jgi:Flp pilus assembly protein CpaB
MSPTTVKSPPSPSTPPRRRGPLATRGGTLAVAGMLAVLAALVLLFFLHQYRTGLTSSDRVQVLVATKLIPQGTPGRVILDDKAYRAVTVRKSDLEEGAVVDPDTLVNKMVRSDVYAGHQLNAKDLRPIRGIPLARLSAYERAITVPVDPAHGMTGDINYGDHVDVLGTVRIANRIGRARVLARDALVLGVNRQAKGGLSGSSKQSVTVRVDDAPTWDISWYADNGKVWVTLRPPLGARERSQ